MSTFVLGDIHGAHRALVQVLERSNFDRENDTLIFLGDVVDGWSESRQCIDELLSIPNLIAILGNHDEWLLQWLDGAPADPLWTSQGGWATLESYNIYREISGWSNVSMTAHARPKIPAAHHEYLRNAKLWHQEADRIFVHGGWDWHSHKHPMASGNYVTWDRDLWGAAIDRGRNGRKRPLTQFSEVYIGHTSTTRHTWGGSDVPCNYCEVWNLDQGAGWEGKLSLMDIDTKQFWQSDVVKTLYPDEAGRR